MNIFLLKILSLILILLQFGCVSTKDAKPKTTSRYPASASTPTVSAPAFTAVADMSSSEGGTIKSSTLTCGASGDKVRFAIVSQDLSFANCSIASDNTVKCSPEYRVLHSSWSSKVKVKCTVSNKDSYSEFKLTVADTNRNPTLADISDQTAFAESAFTTINVNDGTDDIDDDYDVLAYTCAFTGGTFTSSTDCEDLPGTITFSASTGVLVWTPSLSAIDGGDDTSYSVTITAVDGLGGTASKTATLTVAIVAAPTYSSMNPASPSSTSTSPVIIGSASSDTQTVSFYSDSTCATRIGTGSKSEFTGSGITLSISSNATTSIYAKAFDASSHSSLCTSLTTFTHDNTPPAVPTFTSTNPTSASNSSTSPLIIGSTDSDTATVKLFSDSSCSVQIGTGTKASFEGTGITATVSSNATTTIYARAYDTLSNASNCTSLTSFTHDNTGPTVPSFSSSNPSSPTNASTTPLIIGSSSSDTATLKFYTDAACSSGVIGTGTKSAFEGSGIQATVTANATTTIYAIAYDSLSNASTCTSMVSFVHDSTAPTVPTFSSTSPASPNNSSTTPTVIGSASADTVTLNIYSDVSCSTLIGSGSKATFEAAGISLSVSANTTTSIYAKAYDSLSNATACTSLTTYTHDNTAPVAPTFTSTNPVSPSASSTTPTIIGSASADTATLNIYSDSGCSSLIGNGTKATFEAAGISLTVTANTTTTIYAKAYDSLSNATSCTSMTSYKHDNTGPTAPSFSSSNPSTPSGSSSTPLIIGSSSADTATLSFFTNGTCTSGVIGSGTKAEFEGSGIQATVSTNATTTIYAIAYDSLANASTCTSMLSFVHDSTAPTVPTYSSMDPVSPSSSNTTPKVIGSASADTVTLIIYSDVGCTAQIGSGAKATFEAAGISLSVSANTTTSIYAKAYDSLNNTTACTLLTTYTHDNTAPVAPTFTSTNPVSPSASNITPTIIGSASADTATLNIYDDASCSNLIGNGTKATFEAAGISVTVTANTTSTIYAKAYDSLSNATSCTSLTTYKHDNTGPTAPSFSSSNPSTPSGSSSTPLIIGSSSADTATLNFYTNGTCSSAVIGSGTKAEFEGSGIQSTVTANATTTIYALAYDSLSNASTCTSMLSYVHDSTAPTVPSYSSMDPVSPSNSSTTPKIIGSASADTATLTIFSDAGCTTQVGTGSKATFEAAGISLTVTANATTTLYAKAYDSLSNTTACTSMTSYVHDNTAPTTVASLTDGSYYSSLTSSPSLSWTASSDSGSGIVNYQVSLGTSAGATDIVGWTNVGVVTSYQFTGITPVLVNGNSYYANVRVVDNAANTSAVTSSDGWTVDTSAPSDITVTFSGCTTNYLGATWTTSTDAESAISKYEYALGTTSGGTEVVGWTSNANSATLSLASLSLTAGNTYYLSARAVNGASTTSSVNTQSAVCTNLATSLTAFWDMDENSGDRIDSLGSNDLTDNNTVTATGGRVDNAAVFDSANSEYLSSVTNSDLETGDIDFTLSFWVYLTDNSVSTPLINKWGGSTDEFSVEWINSGDIRFKVGTGTLNYSTALNNNTWYHVVVYHDSTNNLLGVSVNGGTATTTAYATGNTVGDSNFTIGLYSGSYFSGRIDAVGFWKKVLTSYERKVLYNSGSGRENPF